MDDLTTRVERLEESERHAWAAIEILAEKQARPDDALAALTEGQSRWRRLRLKPTAGLPGRGLRPSGRLSSRGVNSTGGLPRTGVRPNQQIAEWRRETEGRSQELDELIANSSVR